MGTPEFAVPSLEALARRHEVAAVFSQPDKPRGRGQRLSPTPVKRKALELGIPVYQPERIRDPAVLETLQKLAPEAILVVAYARLIPPAILALPPHGCINVHPSLLPRYRGATPIQAALMNGDATTGVTTFFMDEGYDTGDIILQVETPIGPEETGEELAARLAEMGAELLLATVDRLAEGTAPRIPQPPDGGPYTRVLKKEDLVVDWTRPAGRLRNFIRALAHQPGASTTFRGAPLKLGRSEVAEGEARAEPGTVVEIQRGRGPVVATGEGRLVLTEVKPAGKGWMSGWDWVQGSRPGPGERLG